MARTVENVRKKIKPLDMYTDLLVRKFSANSKNIDLTVGGANQMRFEYDKIITPTSIIKYFQLTRTAEWMSDRLIEDLRTLEMNEDYIGEGVSVNLCLKMEPHFIDWNTRQMNLRASVWEKDMAEAEEQVGQTRLVSEQELAVSKQNTWLQRSWMYFKDMCHSGHSTPVVQIYVELSTGVANKNAYANLRHATISLLTKAITSGYELKEIKGNLWQFQRLFSPISGGNYELEKKTPRFPLTDQYVSHMTSYNPGKLSGTEVLIGLDLDTGKMVYKDFVTNSGGAEILLVAAVTGGGKSFFVKSLTFNTMLRDYTMIVMDRDGEYIPIANEMNGTVISMSRGEGKYYDSTIIGEVTGIENIDNSLLIDSRNATTAVFNILADPIEGMTPYELSVFNDAYNNLYKNYGIDTNRRSTWINSKQLTFHKLYREIVALLDNKTESYLEKFRSSIESLITKFRIYFEPDGIYSYLFKQPIDITNVLNNVDGNAPIVVLHMDLPADAGNDKKDRATFIKLITTNFLLDTILNHNRFLKKFTFEVVEEFQRYLNNDFAKNIVVTQVTGGRKKNANVIVVTNNPDELADAMITDPALKAISGNITSALIGKIQKDTSIEPICRNLQLSGCEGELRKMCDNPQRYLNCFVCKFDGREAAMVKAIVPPEYVKTPLFATRTLKEEILDE